MSKLVVYVPRVTGRERVEVNEEDGKEKEDGEESAS